MIPTEPNPPYDWITTLINFLFLGLAGALGAVVRHIHTPARKWHNASLNGSGVHCVQFMDLN